MLSGANPFTTINEDQQTNGGNQISTLIAGMVSDNDPGALQGIAVTGLNSSTGAWQYSTNDATWTAVGTVANNSALLLPSSDYLRLVPGGIGSTGGVTFRAWDQTSGTAGSDADTTVNGGSTAFSAATATSTITVNNDAPVLSGANPFTTINEDQPGNSGNQVSTLVAGMVSDPDPGAVQGIAVTGLNSSTAPGSIRLTTPDLDGGGHGGQ